MWWSNFWLFFLLCIRVVLCLPLELLLHISDVSSLQQNSPSKVLAFMYIAINHQVLIDCILRRNPIIVFIHKHPLILINSLHITLVEYVRSSVPLLNLWEVFIQIMVLEMLL